MMRTGRIGPRGMHLDVLEAEHSEAGDDPMVDVQQTRATAARLRGWAQKIRHDTGLTNPTADLDVGLLDQAADELEKSAAEIDRLRELISG